MIEDSHPVLALLRDHPTHVFHHMGTTDSHSSTDEKGWRSEAPSVHLYVVKDCEDSPGVGAWLEDQGFRALAPGESFSKYAWDIRAASGEGGPSRQDDPDAVLVTAIHDSAIFDRHMEILETLRASYMSLRKAHRSSLKTWGLLLSAALQQESSS